MGESLMAAVPTQPKNPLHGVTLKAILEELVARRGWADLGARITIRCFTHDPSLSSSLKFLRRTEWARQKVEELYLDDLRNNLVVSEAPPEKAGG